jgi:prolyl-tRNA synthetase
MWQQIKDVLYFDEATKRYILAVIRGDFEVNETKLMQTAGAWDLRSATNEEISEDLNSHPGFISPINMVKKGAKSGYEVVIVGDKSLRTVRNMYGGANKKHRDLLSVNIDRDFKPDIEADIALAQPGFTSPDGGSLVERRGIEVGNIFQLGYHYSDLMQGAEYTDENGKRQKYYMGCYGIGIGRTMAAIVETHHDDHGIMWPDNVSPYLVYLASIGESENVRQAADKLYKDLTDSGVLVLYDDRADVRAGEKFADADLLGISYRVVVSDKTLANQQFEVKKRGETDVRLLAQEEVIKLVSDKQKNSAIMDFRS